MTQSQLIIIGGANGSGKTTLARELVVVDEIAYLGADDIAREINPNHPESAAIEAARLFSRRFGDYLERGESFIVESTLSGLSLRKWIEKARKLDYEVKIHLVYLDSADLCVQRVAVRVAKGGHHVPEEDVRRRYSRSNQNLQIAVGDVLGTTILEQARFEKWLKMAK